MPIYKPEHYEEVITRIRKKLIVKKSKWESVFQKK